MDQHPASNSSPSNAAGSLEDQHNGSSNTNGNANNEIAEVDQLVQTSAESIAAAIPFQLSYTQPPDQITWLPLGSGYVHNLLGQSVVTSTPSGDNSSDQQDPTAGEASATRSMDASSQLYTISSPSSTTTSSSPPGSAAILCSPPSSLLSHQGMFIDVLSRTSQAGGSQDDEEESRAVCLWDGCNQEFSSLSQLVSHLDKGHTLSMSQYICYWKDCPRNLKPFDARYKLITHLRCHTGEKPFRCEVPTCNRCFSRLENLKLHVRTHTGEKPYECHYEGCSKKFNNTSDRAKHMKTHVMRKPYACKYPGCEKSYTDPSSMRKHIKYSHKLKERQERGSSSGSSTETTAPVLEANTIAPPEVSTSSARTPSLSPSSFVFHSPTVTALSPPIHSPHASLPQESARIAHSNTNLKKMVNGAPLVASGPLITSPSQLTPAPQLIPIPLVQLPPGANFQHQLLGLLPQAQKSMILMPSPSPVESPQPIPKPSVIQVIPESSSAPMVTVSLSDGAGTSSQSEQRGDEASQQTVEAQLRQKILQLQQELSHTQSLLAHQNAAMVNQNQTALPQPPLVVQQLPNTNCLTTRAAASVTQNGHIVIPDTPHTPNTTPLAVSLAPLPLASSASSPQIIPIVNSQGFQFLYTPPIPHSSV